MRYRTDWYARRSRQNALFVDYLIDIINEFKDDEFKLSEIELRNLKYEDLGELAGACVNKFLHIVLGKTKDYHNGADIKCVMSQDRNNIKSHKSTGKSHWQNSFMISGVKGKIGDLLVVALNTITCEFEHFLIPVGEYDNTKNIIEIVIQRCTLEQGEDPNFSGIYNPNITSCKWYKHKVKNFETMCRLACLVERLPLNISLPGPDSVQQTKIDPIQQMSIPYTVVIGQQEILDVVDIQPTVLSEIS